MCLYSAYVRKSELRKARVGENLTVSTYQHHPCLMGDDGLITCIRPGTQLTINELAFNRAVNTYEFQYLIGKPVTITLLRGYGHRFTADRFELAGKIISIEWLEEGITARIPRKVRSDKGKSKPRNLDKVLALDQIRADVEKSNEMDDLAREYARDEFAEQF